MSHLPGQRDIGTGFPLNNLRGKNETTVLTILILAATAFLASCGGEDVVSSESGHSISQEQGQDSR